MAEPKRIAILGGGMGGLVAAWELSKEPDRFHVTLYQRGWRLGGKGASGAAYRHADWRIEEHGLHILMGFYRNALEVLGESRREVIAKGAWPPRELQGLDEVLIGQDEIWVGEPRGGDEWELWKNSLSGLRALKSLDRTPLQHALDQLGHWIRFFRSKILGLVGGGAKLESIAESFEANLGGLAAMSREQQLAVAGELDRLFASAFEQAEGPIVSNYRFRQFVAALYLATRIPYRLIQDGLLHSPHDFSSINHRDFQNWLRGDDGPKPPGGNLTWNSPYVRALYDLCFSLGKTLAAGVACEHLLQILFGWKDEIYYKMDGGMGDVVFAPLHLALAARPNVDIRYFHRAVRLHVDGSGRSIGAVTLEPQVRGLGRYDPLLEHPGTALPSWPNEPVLDRMTQEYRQAWQTNGGMPFDFETDSPSPLADASVRIECGEGKDFDDVVLAVSVAGLRGPLCEELRSKAQVDRMLDTVTTMPTRAFQLWLVSHAGGDDGLQWQQGRATAGFAPPFSSCTDMNQTLPHENWPEGDSPETLAYFCGSYPDAPADKPSAVAAVDRDARAWLEKYGPQLLPGGSKGGVFDWNQLIDPDRGFYARANVDPSEQYVLSEAGTIDVRLDPGDTGFDNLFVAGDWVKNSLSSGCLESATLGGRLAAEAIRRKY